MKMHEYFVYLIVPENRIIIVQEKLNNSDYLELMSVTGYNKQQLLRTCNTFCLGYIMGGLYGEKPVNLPEEFK